MTGGTTSNRRYCSPFTGSVARTKTGSVKTRRSPYARIPKRTTAGAGDSGRPTSAWSFTVKRPLPGGSTSQYGFETGASFGIATTRSVFFDSLYGSGPAAAAALRAPGAASRDSSSSGTSERLSAVAVTFTSSPGVADAEAAIASIQRPAASRISSSVSARFVSTSGSGDSFPIAAYARTRTGTTAAGFFASHAASASSRIRATASPPGTRCHVRSTPSKRSSFGGSPRRGSKSFIQVERLSAEPKPWLLCIEREIAAISVYDLPRSALYAPRSTETQPGFGLRGWSAEKRKMFQKSLFGCHGWTYFSCSGNFVGSPASLNASSARIADAVW